MLHRLQRMRSNVTHDRREPANDRNRWNRSLYASQEHIVWTKISCPTSSVVYMSCLWIAHMRLNWLNINAPVICPAGDNEIVTFMIFVSWYYAKYPESHTSRKLKRFLLSFAMLGFVFRNWGIHGEVINLSWNLHVVGAMLQWFSHSRQYLCIFYNVCVFYRQFFYVCTCIDIFVYNPV